MDAIEISNKILELLKASSIPSHDQEMVKLLLPAMNEASLNKIYQTLLSERENLDKLAQKKDRTELKYKIMIEKMTDKQFGGSAPVDSTDSNDDNSGNVPVDATK